MKAKDVLNLGEFDEILTGYAKPASGPGWSNSPFWVIVRDRQTGEFRELCLQPEQQPLELQDWYGICTLVQAKIMRMLN